MDQEIRGDQRTRRLRRTRATHWDQLKEILGDALEYQDTTQCAAYLERACAGETALLREAQRLVRRRTEAFDAFADFAAAKLRRDSAGLLGCRLGAYLIVNQIGHGGMGSVYLAERADGQFTKKVAVKILPRGAESDEILGRFQVEREILARLDHPNITRLFDAGTTDEGLPYFIMEYVDGVPITAFAREQKLSSGETVRLFLKVCRALGFAHREGIVHRDIKPSNILIRSDGEPKLLDFGIAKMVRAEGELTLTQPLDLRLTPRYASPEQSAGNPVDVRSDVYSLGAVLLQLLTHDKKPLRSDFSRVVTRAMAAYPARRYQTVAAFANDLFRCTNRRARHRKLALQATVGAAAALALVLGVARVQQQFRVSPSSTNATVTAPKSLAILPFRASGPGVADESLGFGMADAVTARLSADYAVRVLPATSVARYQQNDAIGAGRALHVDAVLSGTVQRAGERIRVTAQLIDVARQQSLWADTFDETSASLFEVQDTIAQTVAGLFSPGAIARKSAQKHATTSAEAYDAYTMGLYFWNKRSGAALEKAIEYFTHATAIDPQFARAYALLADTYFLQFYLKLVPAAQAVPQSREAAERAIALDPSVAEAHVALATVQSFAGNRIETEKSLRQAIALNPSLAIAHQRYAWTLCEFGRLDEALQEMKRASELDPLSATNKAALGAVLIFRRDYPAALNACKRAVELEPTSPRTQLNLAWVYHLLGRYDEALEAYKKFGDAEERRGDATALMAAVLYTAGRTEEADKLMPQVTKEEEQERLDLQNLIILHLARGEIDRAFQWLQKTVHRVDASGTMLKLDPLLDPLRADPRFAEIIASLQVQAVRESDITPEHPAE